MAIRFGEQTLIYRKGHGRYLMKKQGSLLKKVSAMAKTLISRQRL